MSNISTPNLQPLLDFMSSFQVQLRTAMSAASQAAHDAVQAQVNAITLTPGPPGAPGVPGVNATTTAVATSAANGLQSATDKAYFDTHKILTTTVPVTSTLLAIGALWTQNVTVTGATPGMGVVTILPSDIQASFSTSPYAYVSAANTITIRMTVGSIAIAAGTRNFTFIMIPTG